jgi:hypothetical protein
VVVKSGALRHFAQVLLTVAGATPLIGKGAQVGGSQPDDGPATPIAEI